MTISPNMVPTITQRFNGLSPFSTVAIDRPGVADGLDRMEIGLAGAEGTARENSVCFFGTFQPLDHGALT